MARRTLHTPAERRRALVMAVAMNLALGFAVLSGFAVDTVRRASRQLISFNVNPVSQVEPERPLPAAKPLEPRAILKAAAPAAARATRAPLLAPVPTVPTRTTSQTNVADELAVLDGKSALAGAATSGAGSGAGGVGVGPGGGGSGGAGAGSGAGGSAVPARLLSGNLNRRDYGMIRSLGSPRGGAVLDILVGAEGRLHDCRAVQSSGNRMLDDRLCQLLGRTFWAPARNSVGQPVADRLRYVANWDRN